MKLIKPILLKDLCERFGLSCPADMHNELVTGINEINRVESGDICYVDNKKYYKRTLSSAASFIIAAEALDHSFDKVVLVHPDPFKTYNTIAKALYLENLDHKAASLISSTAIIHKSAVIEDHVQIGDGSFIDANTVIKTGSIIGNNVKIEAGSIIGSDAFYFHRSDDGIFTPWFSCGHVEIEDDVSIGALCTINRGVSSATRIGKGSKLDCHIQIAHGVIIGKHCLIASQVGISGKTIIGDHVKIYGQVGITQNLTIGDHAQIFAQSGVNDNIPAGESWFGSPAIPARQKMKEIFYLRDLGKQK